VFQEDETTLRKPVQLCVLLLSAAITINRAAAQDAPMPGMNMADMNPASMFLMNLSSGTSENPALPRGRCQ
jgi:hypothetical protein